MYVIRRWRHSAGIVLLLLMSRNINTVCWTFRITCCFRLYYILYIIRGEYLCKVSVVIYILIRDNLFYNSTHPKRNQIFAIMISDSPIVRNKLSTTQQSRITTHVMACCPCITHARSGHKIITRLKRKNRICLSGSSSKNAHQSLDR